MKAIQSCNPTSKFFLVKDSLQPLVNAYDLPIDNIEMETSLAKQSAFPNISRLVTVRVLAREKK